MAPTSVTTDSAAARRNAARKRGASWSGRPDLNRGPLAPQASTLPGCATSRDRLDGTRRVLVGQSLRLLLERRRLARRTMSEQRDPGGVVLDQRVRGLPIEAAASQATTEPPYGDPPHDGDRADDPEDRSEHPRNEQRTDQGVRDVAQRASDSGCDAHDSSQLASPFSGRRSPSVIPLPRTRSRRLIMYPRVISIASSRGMPASTSLR
jgi:hypothetical protein